MTHKMTHMMMDSFKNTSSVTCHICGFQLVQLVKFLMVV